MFSTPSDPYLLVALGVGVLAFAMAVVLVLLIVALRIDLRRREAHERSFASAWRPALTMALADGGEGTLPVLLPRERLSFLKLWNYLQESVRGEATDTLNRIARRLQCDALALRLLHFGHRPERLLAILTLGHLRERGAWLDLLGVARQSDPVASQLAARAVMQIDPSTGAEHLLPMILARQDWELGRVARMLREAQSAFGEVLVRSLADLNEAELQRALKLADVLHLRVPVERMRLLLNASRPAPVLAAALRVAADPELAVLARRFVVHENWRVRTRAVQALGRIGEPADAALLTARLDDEAWWVRHHAAHALASQAVVGIEGVAGIRDRCGDPATRHLLEQTMAERGARSHST